MYSTLGEPRDFVRRNLVNYLGCVFTIIAVVTIQSLFLICYMKFVVF